MIDEAEAVQPDRELIETVSVSADDNISSSHPGMVAVRRRRGRRRRKATVDPRFRHIHMIMLVVVFALLALDSTGGSVIGIRDTVFRTAHHVIGPLRAMRHMQLELVALIVAAFILLYLTPGVEEQVLRLFGIKHDNSRKRR